MRTQRLLLGMLVLCLPLAVQAHIASNGFLRLQVDGGRVAGSLELAIRDGELAVGLDRNRDGKVTWGELRASQDALERYLQAHLQLADAAGSCALRVDAVQVNDRVDGSYLWLPFTALCGAGNSRTLRIDYSVLRDEDPSHRGLLTLSAYGSSQTAVLGGADAVHSFELLHPSAWGAFTEYLRAGIWHIWSGIDHLLFLLSLLLPAVLTRRNGRWEAVPMARRRCSTSSRWCRPSRWHIRLRCRWRRSAWSACRPG